MQYLIKKNQIRPYGRDLPSWEESKDFLALKTKSCHDANFVFTGGTHCVCTCSVTLKVFILIKKLALWQVDNSQFSVWGCISSRVFAKGRQNLVYHFNSCNVNSLVQHDKYICTLTMLEVDHRFDFKLTLGTHHISALRGELWGTYYELSVKKKRVWKICYGNMHCVVWSPCCMSDVKSIISLVLLISWSGLLG